MYSNEVLKPIEKMSSYTISPEQSDLLFSIQHYILNDNNKMFENKLIRDIKNFKNAGYNINDKIRYIKLEQLLDLDREEWWTPLQIAIIYITIYKTNNYDIIKILLDNGSDINILDIKDNSILNGCVLSLNYNLLEYVLNNTNIDINIKNDDNRNAFELCEYIQKHYLEMTGLNDYKKHILDTGMMTENELKDRLKQMRNILYKKTIEKDLNYWGLNKLPNTLINNMIN